MAFPAAQWRRFGGLTIVLSVWLGALFSATGSATSAAVKARPAKVRRFQNLSLHDRIAQLIVVRGYGDYPLESDREYQRFVRWIREDHVGGFIVAGRIRNGNVIAAQPFEMAAFINHMQRLARTPLLVASDFERGASMRVAGTARFPYLMAFGAAHDLAAVRELGAATARESRALGVNWVFAPDADVNNNPDNPIINVRSFGEDPAAVAQGVSAFIEGAHANAANYVLVTAKHFPGHGDTAQDSHLELAKVDQPKARLEALELVPFRAAVAHGVDAVMTAHLAVPAFEPRPVPATVSRAILTDLLKNELGFEGIVVTDAMEMQGVASLYSPGEAAVRALEAGADVLLMPTDPGACIRAITAAIASGRLTNKRIEASFQKVMAAKQRTGLFRSHLVDLDQLSDHLNDEKLERLAQDVANRAVTLLRDDKHLFPLAETEGSCLVVLAEGAFPTRGETLARELGRRIPTLKTFVINPGMPEELLSAIARQAFECKRIYAAAFATVAAGRGSVELEGGLPGFLKTLSQGTVPFALISFGNPYLWRGFPDITSYAATFSTAPTSEIAAAKAIMGEIAITGRMPVSIPGLAKIGDGLDVAAKARPASNGTE
jgi:beta-N-acetylhexosaminidase